MIEQIKSFFEIIILIYKPINFLLKQSKEEWRELLNRFYKIALVLLFVVCTVVLIYIVYTSIPLNKTLVLVADFDNDIQKNYLVTENIVDNLRRVSAHYPEVKVQKLNRQIDEPTWLDRADFNRRKASIIIWGRYGVTSDYVQIIPHIEVLKPKNNPLYHNPLYLDHPVLKLAELDKFELQIRLSKDMSYLTLLILGITRNIVEDRDGAIASFRDALNQIQKPILSLDLSTAYFYLADSYFQNGDYEKAITNYDQALKLKPNTAGAYNDRGIACKRQGKYIEAVADYNQAIHLNPDLAEAYGNRGLAYHEKGEYTLAIADYNRALEISPNFAEVYYNRGNSYQAQGAYTLAITDYSQALKLKPKFSLAYGNRGFVYSEQGKYIKAVSDFNQALKLNPNNIDFLNRGLSYSDQGKYTYAIEDFNQAIKLDPNDADAYYNRGLSYLNLDKYVQAVEDYNQAINLNPNDAGAYYKKACAYSLLGESKDDVIENLKQAFNLDPMARAYAVTDSSFDGVRQYEQFQSLMSQ